MAAASTAPTGLERVRVSPVAVAALLVSRSVYRLVAMATVVGLLAVWGERDYATYAAPVAGLAWLVPVVFTGPEKAALKLLPRGEDRRITGFLVLVAHALLGLVILALGLVALLEPPGVRTWLSAGALLLSTGVTFLLVGVHRALARVGWDAVTFVWLTLVQGLGLLLAARQGLGPLGFLVVGSLGTLAANVVLALGLGRPSAALLRDRPLRARLFAESALLGGPDLGWYVSTSLLFALLAGFHWPTHVSTLFVADTVWSAAVNLVVYLLRVRAPEMSVRQEGAAAARVAQLGALRLARRVLVGGLLWLAGFGAAIAAGPRLPVDTRGLLVVWGLALALLTPVVVGALYVSYRFEFTDSRAPRATGLAAACSLVAAGVTGLATIGSLGGLGVVAGLAVGSVVQLLVFVWKGSSHVRA